MDNAFVTQARADPDRVEVRNLQGRWLATLTRGARTVTSAGRHGSAFFDGISPI